MARIHLEFVVDDDRAEAIRELLEEVAGQNDAELDFSEVIRDGDDS